MNVNFTCLASLSLSILFSIPVVIQKESKMNEEFINAAIQGDVAKVRTMLLKDPALARSKDEKGLSIILKATYYGKKDVVEVLLASGVELNIFEAAATGQTQRAAVLLKKDPSLTNAFSADGFMPLALAAFFGHGETVNMLLAAGADVNAVTRESMKVTPLGSAIAGKQNGIARVLIEHGSNVNATAENDFTPLHEAAANGNLELVTLLVDRGANINARTKDGKTALSLALEQKRTEVAQFLRDLGASR